MTKLRIFPSIKEIIKDNQVCNEAIKLFINTEQNYPEVHTYLCGLIDALGFKKNTIKYVVGYALISEVIKEMILNCIEGIVEEQTINNIGTDIENNPPPETTEN
jgi:hypothetical protein